MILSNYGAGEDSFLDQTSKSWRKTILNIHWKDWCWSSNTLATWCKQLTHWKRPWCWKRLKARGEGDDRGWDGWMASPTQWRWVWVNSGIRWWTGRPGILQFMASQRAGHDWATELNWTETVRNHLVSTSELTSERPLLSPKGNCLHHNISAFC